MVSAFRVAQEAARKAIEATYSGTLSVTEMRKTKDERTKLTKDEAAVVLEGQPCRVSFGTLKAAVQSDSAASATQAIKLFVSPDVAVRAGSKITVTQDNVTADYACSGIPAVYPTHQEIILERFRGFT